MQINSSLHTQKNIVTVGEFVDMVNNKNWKRDVSYIIVEEQEEGKWRETGPLIPVTEVYSIAYDPKKSVLEFSTDALYVVLANITEATLMRDIEAPDSEYRYTVYMT